MMKSSKTKKDMHIAHYTSVESLYAILNTIKDGQIKLRLSNIHYMNDTQEAIVGKERVQTLINALKDKYQHDPNVIDVLQEYEKITSATDDYKQPNFHPNFKSIFLISFTKHIEDNDLRLSHWRAYGDDTRGVCLVFDYHMLKQETKNTKSRVARLNDVTYVTEETEDIKELVDNKIPEFLQKNDAKALSSYLDGALAFYKHRAFQDEQEYRLMIAPKNMDDDVIKYYDKDKDIVPCYEITVDVGVINKIIIGSSAKLKKPTLEYFLQSKGIPIKRYKSEEIDEKRVLHPNASHENRVAPKQIEVEVSDLPYLPKS